MIAVTNFSPERVRVEPHALTKTLSSWYCSCGRYGVLYSAEEREGMTACPVAGEGLLTAASRPSPRHVYVGRVFVALREGGPESSIATFSIEQRDRYAAEYLAKGCVVSVEEFWNAPR